jgi:polyphosphate kinase
VRLRAEAAVILDALFSDTRFSWTLDSDGRWQRRTPKDGDAAVSAQELLMTRALRRAKKR